MKSVLSSLSSDAKSEAFRFQVTRRTFLQRCLTVAAATGLPVWFVERQLSAAEPAAAAAANDRPNVALVGCGGMGRVDASNASAYGNIVAVCDVDAANLARAVEQFTVDGKKPGGFQDVRRLLERTDVHAIVNATPDHWHTLVNLAAARAGKDVYSEKPLTLTIEEGRHVVEAVRKGGIVLQTGSQQRSMQRFRLVSELVRNGRIGKLRRAQVWLPAGLHGGPFDSAPVPAELDWNFWLGQAPFVDYVPERCHAKFRFWYDYSGGTITDWGAHHIDIVCWAVGNFDVREIEPHIITEPVMGGYTAYPEYTLRYAFANGVEMHVNTTRDDDIYGGVVNPAGQRNGIRFEGTDGWIWVNRRELRASDPDLLKAPLPEGAERLYESRDHWENFFSCMRSRQAPICDVETGHRSATVCHLGTIALRTGRKLTWDAGRERFTGDSAQEANAHLAREMRAPYDYTFGA
jgi:predicted dehydrogenase